ncbi:trypsin-like peptidase domain-containing protein [Nocardioides sp. TRM66260-LWL]|uniref:S1C family serine protease n=1 Tax=Nocardioides sp. TRM66260-LWL TaxID=2874478 RepID=UPI001CC4EA54|nr:trypsin-like peptidase domain-containing protein [Nocardioides sp. TRM66260-LWL]MBZ5735011.1 trypsin-like peptidase domain-containing protein [Nocardioides sp. TRM66260-LWL]
MTDHPDGSSSTPGEHPQSDPTRSEPAPHVPSAEAPGDPHGPTAHDDTAPIQPVQPVQPAHPAPGAGAPGWGEPEPTTAIAAAGAYGAYAPYGSPEAASPFGPTDVVAGSASPRPASRKRFVAAVVAAAVLAGGAGGVGGAAAWSALTGDDGGSGITIGSGPVTASKVVDSTDAPAADGSVEKAAQDVLPSVVKIYVQGSQESGSGSGIILSSDGKILTNDHVVEVAGQGGTITVAFSDGSTHTAKVLGTDPLTDTAVIQASGVSGLTPATIGKSSGLKVGQDVVAIGSPFGLESTVTSGIVSALNRPVDVGSDSDNNATVYPAIQTDAAINPGNSGGPLVDMAGHVVGINASIRTSGSSGLGGSEGGSIGLGFAIPIDEVLPVVQQMLDGETPTHARLGISVADAASSKAAAAVGLTNGAEVKEIGDGSTAAAAGLKVGDVITKVDDTQVTGSDSLVATVRSYRPGDTVSVTYVRDGDTNTVQLKLDSDAKVTNS